MADLHVKNTGSGTSPFDTWAKAAANLGAVTGAAAGDRYLLSSAHAGSTTGYSLSVPGTPANPCQLLCGTEAGASGISALAATAVETITGTTFTIAGSLYAQGLIWDFTSTSSGAPNYASSNGSVQRYKDCIFRYTGSRRQRRNSYSARSPVARPRPCILENCGIRGPSANFNVGIEREVIIRDGYWESGGGTQNYVFNVGVGNKPVGFFGRRFRLHQHRQQHQYRRRHWRGQLQRDCSAAASSARAGRVRSGHVRSDQAGHQGGDVRLPGGVERSTARGSSNTRGPSRAKTRSRSRRISAYKAVTNANIKYPLGELEIFQAYRSLAAGVAKTFKAQHAHRRHHADQRRRASARGVLRQFRVLPRHVRRARQPASPIASATSLPTNSAAWASAPGTPVKQEASLTFTPAQAGFCHHHGQCHAALHAPSTSTTP
jgi:hypothetical protein